MIWTLKSHNLFLPPLITPINTFWLRSDCIHSLFLFSYCSSSSLHSSLFLSLSRSSLASSSSLFFSDSSLFLSSISLFLVAISSLRSRTSWCIYIHNNCSYMYIASITAIVVICISTSPFHRIHSGFNIALENWDCQANLKSHERSYSVDNGYYMLIAITTLLLHFCNVLNTNRW